MDLVAPPVRLLVHLRFSLEQGSSVQEALHTYLDYVDDQCAELVRGWWVSYQRGMSQDYIFQHGTTVHRRVLLQTLEDGLNGDSVLSIIRDLETEFLEQAQADIERFLRTLPFRAMIPLMLFLFPAYLILFFGPLLQSLMQALAEGG